MKKKIGLGILAVILLISASSVFLIQKQSLTEHQKAWISDLEGPFKEVLASSAGINENMTEEERNRRIDEIIEAIRTKHWDDERIGYAVKELISDFQIAHMQFILCDEYAAQSEYYPIIGKWFGDEYRITETTPEYEQYIGYAIRKINNLDMSEVLKRYDTIIPNETQPFGEYPICYRLAGKIFAQFSPREDWFKITLKTNPDAENPAFIELCAKLDATLNSAIGAETQQQQYNRFNQRDSIHDVIVIFRDKKPVGYA